MKTNLLALSFFLTTTTICLAQRVVSPEVSADNRVTFRLRAPDAKQVSVRCEGVTETQMQKDEHGIWSLTTPAMDPDIYVYSFTVDGVRNIDLNNPLIKYNLLNIDSQVHVPGPLNIPWELNDVPHGELHRHFYHSKVAGDDRDFIVYTPPGYDPGSRKRYPVLYLLHGYSDDATAWSTVGMANVILDNLIARKEAKPMVVVMPLGYGTMEVVRAGWERLRQAGLWQRNLEGFRDALLNEVMPQAEKDYRIQADANSRAIAGLSMGGSESLMVGLNHLERFNWVGAFSSGGLNTNYTAEFPSLDQKANNKIKLLWIGCGEQDHLITDNQKFCDWLKSQGVHYTWVQTPGQHSFRVWRRYLAQVAPLLFK